MDEAELDQVRERIEWSMAQQRREYGDDECQWPWATVPETTVQKRPSHIRKLQLQVAELRAIVDRTSLAAARR